MDEELGPVASLALVGLMIPLLFLLASDAEPVQYILFVIGYALILLSIYIGYVLIMRILF